MREDVEAALRAEVEWCARGVDTDRERAFSSNDLDDTEREHLRTLRYEAVLLAEIDALRAEMGEAEARGARWMRGAIAKRPPCVTCGGEREVCYSPGHDEPEHECDPEECETCNGTGDRAPEAFDPVEVCREARSHG